MKYAILAILIGSVLTASARAGQYDNPTPPNASAINVANGVSEPVEPKHDTTRESIVRAMQNG